MNNSHIESENRVLSRLQETLDALGGDVGKTMRVLYETQNQYDKDDLLRRHDADIEIVVADHPLNLMVECKSKVYPRDVRDFVGRSSYYKLAQRKRPINSTTPELVPVLAADVISPGAKELMHENRIGYFDTGGSLYIPATGILLLVDRPPAKDQKRSEMSLFKGARAQVIHALLHEPNSWLSVKDLALNALVSPSLTSETLTELENQEWVEARGNGRTKERMLKQPGRLLDEWAKQTLEMRSPAIKRYFVPQGSADQIITMLAGYLRGQPGIDYAITHEAAAQRYAPLLTSVSQVRCRWLGPPNFYDAFLRWMDAKPVDEGSNLSLIRADSRGDLLFSQEVNGVRLASPIQVYLDLLRSEGRAKEMAQHLRETKIGF